MFITTSSSNICLFVYYTVYHQLIYLDYYYIHVYRLLFDYYLINICILGTDIFRKSFLVGSAIGPWAV